MSPQRSVGHRDQSLLGPWPETIRYAHPDLFSQFLLDRFCDGQIPDTASLRCSSLRSSLQLFPDDFGQKFRPPPDLLRFGKGEVETHAVRAPSSRVEAFAGDVGYLAIDSPIEHVGSINVGRA